MSEEPGAEKEAVAEKATEADDAEAEQDLAHEELASEEPAAGKEAVAEKADGAQAEEDPALEETMSEEPGAEKAAEADGAHGEENPAPEETMSEEPGAEKAVAGNGAEAEEVVVLEDLVAAEPPVEKKAAVAKKTRSNKNAAQLGTGLSDGERDDLQKLIKGLKEEEPSSERGAALEDIEKQIKSMSKRLAELGVILLKHDTRMKSFHEIMRLYYQKSEAMNKRMDAIIESIKGEGKV